MPDRPLHGVSVRSPAKINLVLGVGSPRPDGYHPLATVFQAVGIHDDVTVSPAGTSTLTITGEGVEVGAVPTDASNLALRAARALAARHGLPASESGVTLRIHKRIPVAGGMAGGSTDAAATLVACDRLWGLATPREELLTVAAELGSDVPFCLVGETATGEGRGERVSPLTDAGEYWWVAALPGGGLSTPGVYGELDRLRGDGPEIVPTVSDDLLRALAAGSVRQLARALSNDLQAAALSLRPELADVLELGRSCGALAGLVSGSGPTCLFLAGDADHADRLAQRLRGEGVACLVAGGPVPGATLLPGL